MPKNIQNRYSDSSSNSSDDSNSSDNRDSSISPVKVSRHAKPAHFVKKRLEDLVEIDEPKKSNSTPVASNITTARKNATPAIVLSNFDEITDMINQELERMKTENDKTKSIKFLKSLSKKIKDLRLQTTKVTKQKTPRAGMANSGFNKQVPISKELAKFTGWGEDELHSRTEATRFICDYIKEHDLQAKDDKRNIELDSKLRKLFGVSKDIKTPFKYCDIQRGFSQQNHFPKKTS